MMKLTVLFCTCIFLLSGCSVKYPHKDSQKQMNTKPILTPRETIEQFFDRQYEAYTSLQYQAVDDLLDMSKLRNRNEEVWLKTLIQRRELIAEHNLCFISTEHIPYTITFNKYANDERMQVWKQMNDFSKDEQTIHFTITGQKDCVYPPFFALNAQHTMRLKQIDGRWVITFHFFPGAERKFGFQTALTVPTQQRMLNQLKQEFKIRPVHISNLQVNAPDNAILYQGKRAAEYAKTYIESANPAFYCIGDWMGNCSNFASQCIWYGFCKGIQPDEPQEFMTSEWFAGTGGGSPAWENVEHFWNYATEEKSSGLMGEVVDSIHQLKPGGLIQVCTKGSAYSDEGYNHSLMMVDPITLTLAQNTPNCFVYYSDLVYTDIRFFNPTYQIMES